MTFPEICNETEENSERRQRTVPRLVLANWLLRNLVGVFTVWQGEEKGEYIMNEKNSGINTKYFMQFS